MGNFSSCGKAELNQRSAEAGFHITWDQTGTFTQFLCTSATATKCICYCAKTLKKDLFAVVALTASKLGGPGSRASPIGPSAIVPARTAEMGQHQMCSRSYRSKLLWGDTTQSATTCNNLHRPTQLKTQSEMQSDAV